MKLQPKAEEDKSGRELKAGGEGVVGRICFRTIFSVPPCKGVGRQE